MKIVKFEYSLFGVNTYLVYDPQTKDCAVVDPGMINQEERDAICNFIEKNGLRLTHIINTHLHIDHAAGNAWLKSKYGADVYASAADAPLGSQMSQQARMFGLPFRIEDAAADHPLINGEIISIGEGSLRVIATPGHSPGGICLYDEADGFLISGDTLFDGSIGRTDLPGGDYAQLIDSIRTRLLDLPGDTVVYPGHGPATTIAKERASNPFLR